MKFLEKSMFQLLRLSLKKLQKTKQEVEILNYLTTLTSLSKLLNNAVLNKHKGS